MKASIRDLISVRAKRPGYWQQRVFEDVDLVTGRKGYRTQVELVPPAVVNV